MPLSPDYFCQSTEKIARHMLGMYLVHDHPKGLITGRIVETEAYVSNDPASHAFKGQTKRNAPMFSYPGTVYVYRIYGMYYCLNIVTAPEGVAEAVLIRAVEPLDGLEVMQRNRGVHVPLRDLCRGPGRLCQAFGIDLEFNGANIREGSLRLEIACEPLPLAEQICESPRIGIAQGSGLPLRYYLKNSQYVSGATESRFLG